MLKPLFLTIMKKENGEIITKDFNFKSKTFKSNGVIKVKMSKPNKKIKLKGFKNHFTVNIKSKDLKHVKDGILYLTIKVPGNDNIIKKMVFVKTFVLKGSKEDKIEIEAIDYLEVGIVGIEFDKVKEAIKYTAYLQSIG